MSHTDLKKGIPGWGFEKRRHESFQFLEEPHEYHLQGKRLWSPSGVFVEVGYCDPTYYKEEHRHRGSYVHWATRLIDEDDLDWKDIAAEYFGFIEAYAEFKMAWKFRARQREKPMYHPQYLYGVTPDAEGIILDGDEAIVELKTVNQGSIPWWTRYQVAAQSMAIKAWDTQDIFRRRFGVALLPTGKFKVKEFDEHPDDDDLTWQSNLRTANKHYAEPPRKIAEVFRQ